jgi:hypothetical protein
LPNLVPPGCFGGDRDDHYAAVPVPSGAFIPVGTKAVNEL